MGGCDVGLGDCGPLGASSEPSSEPALDEGPTIGKEVQGQLGAKVTAEPPKGACYPSLRGLHPRPASPEKGPRSSQTQGYKYLGWLASALAKECR